MLLIALAAVNRPGSVRLERNLSLLAAFGAGNVGHFSWSAAIAASKAAAIATVVVLSLEHLIHLPCYRFKEPIMLQKTSQQISLNRRKM